MYYILLENQLYCVNLEETELLVRSSRCFPNVSWREKKKTQADAYGIKREALELLAPRTLSDLFTEQLLS
jgi:hypothetical protein